MWMASWRSSKWDPPLNWMKRRGEVWRHLKLLSGSVCSLVDFWLFNWFTFLMCLQSQWKFHFTLICSSEPVALCWGDVQWALSPAHPASGDAEVCESQSSLGSIKEDKGISSKRCVSKCPFVILLIFTVHLEVDQSVTQFGIRFIHKVKNKRRKL